MTGGTGFVGRALRRRLHADGLAVRLVLRRDPPELFANETACVLGEFVPGTQWSELLRNVDTVFHLAARVHHRADAAGASTPELLRKAATAMGRRPRLYHVPEPFLRVAESIPLLGRSLSRLTRSLVVDTSKIRELAGWSAPFSTEEGLGETCAWFLATRK